MTAPAPCRPLPLLALPLQRTAQYIAQTQRADGAIPWYSGGKLDPWDHTEAAMGLNVAGYHRAAERAYAWLADNQLDDGSWRAEYFIEDSAAPGLRETNFVAYVATGVWHHYLITGNSGWLREQFNCVTRAMDFVIRYQTAEGDIAWAVDGEGRAQNDALVTACASILRSLDCACRIAEVLNQPYDCWRQAGRKLRDCLLNKPQRFDRTWESKARFSMDWYYPILAGLYDSAQARERLAARWAEFVEPEMGCRCVSDEPWVTMAETSELVIALMASQQPRKAAQLFATLAQWRDSDGGYWTGYVFRDNTIWPADKTTWTAGAVLLAADALQQLTPGSQLFQQPLTGID